MSVADVHGRARYPEFTLEEPMGRPRWSEIPRKIGIRSTLPVQKVKIFACGGYSSRLFCDFDVGLRVPKKKRASSSRGNGILEASKPPAIRNFTRS